METACVKVKLRPGSLEQVHEWADELRSRADEVLATLRDEGVVVVVEQLFSLPGLGRMLVSDVGNRDLVKVQSTLLVLTGVVLAIGALVDVVPRAIDPRLRNATS